MESRLFPDAVPFEACLTFQAFHSRSGMLTYTYRRLWWCRTPLVHTQPQLCGSAAHQTSLHPVRELEQLSLSTSHFLITIVKLFWKVVSVEEFPWLWHGSAQEWGSSCAGLAGRQATVCEMDLLKLMYWNVFTFCCLFFPPYMKCSDFRNIYRLLQSSETFSQRVLTCFTAAPFSQILANSLIMTMASLNT